MKSYRLAFSKKLSEKLPWTLVLKPFRIVALQNPAKNGLSSIGVPRSSVPEQYTFHISRTKCSGPFDAPSIRISTSLVFTVFSANLAWLWITIAFQIVSKDVLDCSGTDPMGHSMGALSLRDRKSTRLNSTHISISY